MILNGRLKNIIILVLDVNSKPALSLLIYMSSRSNQYSLVNVVKKLIGTSFLLNTRMGNGNIMQALMTCTRKIFSSDCSSA